MNYRLWGASMQGEVYRISMQSMWPVVVHLMGIGCLNSKPPETIDIYRERRNKNVEKYQMSVESSSSSSRHTLYYIVLVL